MDKIATHIIFVLVMVAIIVAADVLFFRYQFWCRLLANVGIVLIAIAFYLRFLQ